MVHGFADAAGVSVPEPGLIPSWVVRGGGLVSTDLRELGEMLYQFRAPFVIDSTRSQELLGFGPTPTEDVLRETVAWWRTEAAEMA